MSVNGLGALAVAASAAVPSVLLVAAVHSRCVGRCFCSVSSRVRLARHMPSKRRAPSERKSAVRGSGDEAGHRHRGCDNDGRAVEVDE